jgi:putative spermidine/putrescine transport system permease protein
MTLLDAPANESQITHRQRLWLYAFGGLALLFLIFPIFIVFPISFSDSRFLKFPPDAWSLRWYEHYFTTPEWMLATWVSLRVALGASVLATVLGVAAAYGVHLLSDRLGRYLEIVLLLPLMVPLIITAVGVFFVYARVGLIASVPGLVLSHTMLALPFVVVTTHSGLKSFDMDLELAARSLGASRLRAFFQVTLPQIRGSVIAGAVFAFIYALDEVVVAIFISGGPNATLTKRMFTALRDEIEPTIAAISALLITFSLTVAVIALAIAARPAQGRG